MKCQSVFGKLMDTMFPRADRCAGFFVWDGAAGQENPAPLRMLAETDDDLKPLILGQLGGLGCQEVPWNGLGREAGSTYGYAGLLFRVPRPDDPAAHLWDEAGRCCRMMLRNVYNMPSVSSSSVLARRHPELHLCMPTTMVSMARKSLLSGLGIQYDMDHNAFLGRPGRAPAYPEVEGFNVREWTGLLPETLVLGRDTSHEYTGYVSAMREIPGVFRFMWECLRGRTYYLYVKGCSGMRNMNVQVMFPAAAGTDSLDGMARLAARIMATEYAAGQRVMAHGQVENLYGDLGVYMTAPLAMHCDTLINTMASFMGKGLNSVEEDSLESEKWFESDDTLVSILREAKGPGGAAWYRRGPLGEADGQG